jgi:hypothetical protein
MKKILVVLMVVIILSGCATFSLSGIYVGYSGNTIEFCGAENDFLSFCIMGRNIDLMMLKDWSIEILQDGKSIDKNIDKGDIPNYDTFYNRYRNILSINLRKVKGPFIAVVKSPEYFDKIDCWTWEVTGTQEAKLIDYKSINNKKENVKL